MRSGLARDASDATLTPQPRSHLASGGSRLQYRFLQALNVRESTALVINWNEPPRNVRGLRLQCAGGFEEMSTEACPFLVGTLTPRRGY